MYWQSYYYKFHTGKVGFPFTNSKNPSPTFPRALSLKILQYLQASWPKLSGPKQSKVTQSLNFLPLITQDTSPSGWEEAWCVAPKHQYFTSQSSIIHQQPANSTFQGGISWSPSSARTINILWLGDEVATQMHYFCPGSRQRSSSLL